MQSVVSTADSLHATRFAGCFASFDSLSAKGLQLSSPLKILYTEVQSDNEVFNTACTIYPKSLMDFTQAWIERWQAKTFAGLSISSFYERTEELVGRPIMSRLNQTLNTEYALERCWET